MREEKETGKGKGAMIGKKNLRTRDELKEKRIERKKEGKTRN